jgi:hypothetical protein
MTTELDWLEYNDWQTTYSIPKPAHEALVRYFVHGIEPGGFLTAILVGDLFTAAFKADYLNSPSMANIAKWIVHHAPHNSYGTADIVKKWCNDPTIRADFEKKVLWHYLHTDGKPKDYDHEF